MVSDRDRLLMRNPARKLSEFNFTTWLGLKVDIQHSHLGEVLANTDFVLHGATFRIIKCKSQKTTMRDFQYQVIKLF